MTGFKLSTVTLPAAGRMSCRQVGVEARTRLGKLLQTSGREYGSLAHSGISGDGEKEKE